MPNVTVTYLFDPLCGWCYAAAPALKFLQAQEGVEVVLAPTGLFAGAGAVCATAVSARVAGPESKRPDAAPRIWSR